VRLSPLAIVLAALPSAITPGFGGSLQWQSPAAPNGSITGTVTIDGKPAAHLTVVLLLDNHDSPTVARTATDDAGRFHLTDLSSGRYRVTVIAPTWAPPGDPNTDAAGKPVSLKDGQKLEGINLSLVRGGVITGRVVGQDGSPISDEEIALCPIADNGSALPCRRNRGLEFGTDDRGLYRIYGVPPGRYTVSVGKDPGEMGGLHTGGNYVRTFHPSTTDQNRAVPIEVTSGGEATGVDITGVELKVRRGSTVSGGGGDGQEGATTISQNLQRLPRREASITGRILTSDGQPLVAADVILVPFGGSLKSARQDKTDDEGNFTFSGLATGAYSILAWDPSRMGFFPDEQNDDFDGPRICRPGDFVEMVVTREKPGVVTGRVAYPNGEPVVEAIVRAFRVRDSHGRRVPPSALSLLGGSDVQRKTDDRGVYRMWDVEPGSYVIAAGGKPNHGITFTSPDPTDYDGDARTYYGDSAQGSPWVATVAPGAEVSGIDIQYRGGAGHTISGTFSRAPLDGVNYYQIHLTDVVTGSEPSDYNILRPGESTSFTFSNLPDGDYDITAMAELPTYQYETLSPTVRVSVRGADVSGVALGPIAFASISGRVALDSSDQNRGPDCQSKRIPLIQESALIFRRSQPLPYRVALDRAHRSSIEVAVESTGNFAATNLEPGTYRLRPDLPGDTWYIASITAPGPDSATPLSTTFSVKGGERISPLVVLLRNGAATLRGRILTSTVSATSLPSLRIHLVPLEPGQADDRLRFAETAVKTGGAFAFGNIAPGRYRLLARPATESADGQPLAESSEGRALLRRDAQRIGMEIQLGPCQKLGDFELRYREPPEAKRSQGFR